MPAVEYQGLSHVLAPAETVLDGLLRNGVDAPHACKAGTCRSCMMRVVSGSVPSRSQAGLKDSWQAQGYFLPCVCIPDADLTVAPAGTDVQIGATIAALELLSRDIMCVRLHCDSQLTYRAGQYVTLLRVGGVARSYSIASLPDGSFLELHVRLIRGGRMSGWLHEHAHVGDRLSVMGPSGECFYVKGNEEQPLLLAGTGTGLAPLYGILLDALRHGHTGPIHLFHGARHKGGLYLVEQLRSLAAAHRHFEFIPSVLNGLESDGFAVGALDRLLFQQLPKLNRWRVYICGDPTIVQMLKKKVFLAGAASRDIYADAFLPAV